MNINSSVWLENLCKLAPFWAQLCLPFLLVSFRLSFWVPLDCLVAPLVLVVGLAEVEASKSDWHPPMLASITAYCFLASPASVDQSGGKFAIVKEAVG